MLDGRNIAIMGAFNGHFGTIRGKLHPRQMLHATNARPLGRPSVLMRRAQDHFDVYFRLMDDYVRGET